MFALANGHVGVRANLDEGEPYGLPGTYLNGFYELRPLPYAEGGFGYPESGQALVNVTNGKVIRLLVDDEPFDVRYGQLHGHERRLDLRTGVLERIVDWTSAAGRRVHIRSQRMVSLTQRAIMAICYEVEPVDGDARLVVQSELLANEPLPMPGRDPRVAAALSSPLQSEGHWCRSSTAAELVHRTTQSGLLIAAAMDHVVDGPPGTEIDSESSPDRAAVTITGECPAGDALTLVKFVAYGWSGVRSRQALRDQVIAAGAAATHSGWDGLVAEQRRWLDDFWTRADIRVDADPVLQHAIRFNMLHLLQATARAEQRAIPAKGLTGTGYDGHAFWDTETFVLQVVTYIDPCAAADALRWRHSTLPLARRRAETLGLAGAAFPWRTIAGAECSSYWPASTAAFHINADIACAVLTYIDATEDHEFASEVGLELLAETARLWLSLGQFDHRGRFRLAGVTGPDEYSALSDDNVFTNLMAQWNLQGAADAATADRPRADELGISPSEISAWANAATSMYVPFDDELGVHPQSLDFTTHEIWDFDATPADHYPLMLNYPYFDLYRKQVVKQADLVLAMQLRPDAFTDEQRARNFAYYEGLTVRDSSLSAQTQGVIAARVGHLDLAYDYLAETTCLDVDDQHHDTGSGLHLAALAGSWSVVARGFGGFTVRDGRPSFDPRIPRGLGGVSFPVTYRGSSLRVNIGDDEVRYELVHGPPLTILHRGEELEIRSSTTMPTGPPPREGAAPKSPRTREPYPRHESLLPSRPGAAAVGQ